MNSPAYTILYYGESGFRILNDYATIYPVIHRFAGNRDFLYMAKCT
jgi:hypothetical protein